MLCFTAVLPLVAYQGIFLLSFPFQLYSIYSIYKWFPCCAYCINLPHELTEVKHEFILYFAICKFISTEGTWVIDLGLLST